MLNHKITDRPATIDSLWMMDLNKINTLPGEAIVAVVQSFDLTTLSAPNFHAIVAMIDNEAKRRQQISFKGSNKNVRRIAGDIA
jgi:hypothetical protein